MNEICSGIKKDNNKSTILIYVWFSIKKFNRFITYLEWGVTTQPNFIRGEIRIILLDSY